MKKLILMPLVMPLMLPSGFDGVEPFVVMPEIKTVSRLTNASALARELGVTREHLWRVVTGRRESRRLAAQLRQRGVKVAKGGK